MPNTKRATGFRPYGEVRRINQYVADTTIYPGDLVVHGSSGNVTLYTSSAVAVIGVAASYGVSQGAPLLVWDHPDQEFVIGSDGATPSNQTDLFLNYQVTTTAGSSQYKVSRMALTGTSGGTVATMPLKTIFIDSRPDNALGAYADVVVMLNNHVFKGGTGQVGV